MPTYDAAIFDLDGTLVDSLRDIGEAMNHALAAHGLPTYPLDVYRQLVGEGVRRLTERTVPAERPELIDPVLAEYRRFYTEHLLVSTRPFEGIEPLLDALCARGMRLAVLSNKPDPATQTIVRALFSRWPLRAVQGERSDVPRKPDPTGALQLARVLETEPSRCLFVGDSGIDMQTAVNAGMLPVGVLWGLRDRDELLRHGARWLLAEPRELIARLDH